MSLSLTNILTFLQTYGYVALWALVFTAAVGAPLPIVLVLLAAGAFAAVGDFNIFLLVIIAITASVAGDNTGYLVGRKWGSRVLDWLERSRLGTRLLPPRAIERSRIYFKQRGGWAIFFSRFLVAALGGIINLLAGSELFPYRAFLACDIAGEAIGAAAPLTLGFIFSASWEEIGDIFGSLSLLFIAIFIVIVVFIFFLRYLHHLQHARQLTEAREKQQAEAQRAQSMPMVAPSIDPPRPSSGQLPFS
jgi:membrane-associated protein